MGWTRCVTKIENGSVMSINWNINSNSLYCGFGDGSVKNVIILEKSISNNQYTITQTELNKLLISNVLHEMSEEIEFPNEITYFDFTHNQCFVVCTNTQLFVYDPNQLNNKIKIEINDPVNFIFSSSNYFGYVGTQEGI